MNATKGAAWGPWKHTTREHKPTVTRGMGVVRDIQGKT